MTTENHPIFSRYSDLKEFVRILQYEVQQAQRPANEVILDDERVMRMLNICKRKLQYMKSGKELPYHTPGKGNRTYFLLSDILEWMRKGRTESLSNSRRL